MICIFQMPVREVDIMYLRQQPAWKFLSGFLCRKWCLMYVHFCYATLFMCIPEIINKGHLVENLDEGGF